MESILLIPESNPPLAVGESWEGRWEGADGERLDKALAETRPDVSRTRWRRYIDEGRVSVNGTTVRKPREEVKGGGALACRFPPPEADREFLEPLEMPLEVLYEDGEMLVVNKPAGLVVHPAAGHAQDTLVNALVFHCREELPEGRGGAERKGIVHRLDKDTSGVLVAAKTEAAQTALGVQFSEHTTEKHYVALVKGVPRPGRGTIDRPIARDPRNRQRMAVAVAGGRPAVTHYETLASGGMASLVHLRIETGRTHQIRVHMASIGHGVCGDAVYSRARQGLVFPRQMLHAHTLRLRHPSTGEAMTFVAPPPEDFTAALETLVPGYPAEKLRGAFPAAPGSAWARD